jgi:glycosyltransferase involved in cell wall biosynthesis
MPAHFGPGDGISVVIPAFNAARYLQAAVGSVLAQTWPVGQIIVVDDGSTDGTAAVAAKLPGVELVSRPHAGIAATRNAGIERASGRYLAFLDADDLWLPDKLERQRALLLSEPQAHGVFGLMRSFVSPELPPDQRGRFRVDPAAVTGHVAGCLLIEREAFLRAGLFDAALAGGEFIDWMLRARAADLQLPSVQEHVLWRRIHGANTVLTATESMSAAYFQLIRKKLGKP